METKITNEDKIKFLDIILRRRFHKRECVWLLNYLKSKSNLLENTHFVENISGCEKAMVMTTVGSKGDAFKFIHKKEVTTSAEKVFLKIREKPESDLYIQINFEDSMKCSDYLAIMEENPFIQPLELSDKIKEEANEFIEFMSSKLYALSFEEKINDALDTNNKELFIKLTRQHIEVMNKK